MLLGWPSALSKKFGINGKILPPQQRKNFPTSGKNKEKPVEVRPQKSHQMRRLRSSRYLTPSFTGLSGFETNPGKLKFKILQLVLCSLRAKSRRQASAASSNF